jgi:serine protease Do
VVKIEAENLKVPKFVHPKDVKVGQWCFVLGRTFGIKDCSVHMGVVSAKDRIFGRAIQTDAYTSPANYGGPLMDVRGQFMGISAPLAASGRQAGEDLYDSGIGFGATIADIWPLIERMKQGEVLHRGYLGVATVPSFMGPGAKLSRVQKKSPARNAGIRKGDTILEIDSVKVENSFHLQMLVGSKMVGDPVAVKYKKKRGGDVITVTVFLEKVGAAQMKPKKKEQPDSRLPWEEEEEGKDKDK